MSTLARNETRRQLRYVFTESERLEKGKQLADALNRLASTESDLDRIKADFKSRTAAIDTEIGTLKDGVFSGFELREYVCFWEYDQPEKGKKTLRRKEPPSDVVGVEEMTEADRQTVIESIEAQTAPAENELKIVPYSPPADAKSEDDEAAWKQALAEDRARRKAEKAAPKRRTAPNGVVATPVDGPDLSDPDTTKSDR